MNGRSTKYTVGNFVNRLVGMGLNSALELVRDFVV